MTFNVWTFLLQALNFAVLAYVLHRLLYRPLSEAIDRRRQASAQAQADAEKARKEAEALHQQLLAQQAELDQQRQAIIRAAREQADADRQRLLADADRTIHQRHTEARQALDRQKDELLEALRGDLVAQALALAERLLAAAADRTLHHQLALRLVETLENLPEAERPSLREAELAEQGAVLEAARELDEATLARVRAALAAAAGRPLPFAVQLRPALLGGVRLCLAGHVWDASLAGQLGVQEGGGGGTHP